MYLPYYTALYCILDLRGELHREPEEQGPALAGPERQGRRPGDRRDDAAGPAGGCRGRRLGGR